MPNNKPGDVTAVSDVQSAGGTQTQCFAYDSQQELTTAWTDAQCITTTPTPPASTTLYLDGGAEQVTRTAAGALTAIRFYSGS